MLNSWIPQRAKVQKLIIRSNIALPTFPSDFEPSVGIYGRFKLILILNKHYSSSVCTSILSRIFSLDSRKDEYDYSDE
ncbi:hypothetical protein O3M35_001794 [Rhynocoris fuscipes]|uniref:Uncharacterized protein n=1 Tax=Rhynocoris fuscipes TaxID=488301 RepID=A0AAW1CWF4_9HEMI